MTVARSRTDTKKITRGIETYSTGVYASDLYMLLEVLKHTAQEYMYLIYICY